MTTQREPDATNHVKDPNCKNQRDVWKATATKVGEYYQYSREDSAVPGAVHVWMQRYQQPLLKVNGTILYATIRFDDPSYTYRLENCVLISDVDDGDGTHHILAEARNGADANKTIQIYAGQPWMLMEAAVYSAEDWPHVREWYESTGNRPFFDGSTKPRNS